MSQRALACPISESNGRIPVESLPFDGDLLSSGHASRGRQHRDDGLREQERLIRSNDRIANIRKVYCRNVFTIRYVADPTTYVSVSYIRYVAHLLGDGDLHFGGIAC